MRKAFGSYEFYATFTYEGENYTSKLGTNWLFLCKGRANALFSESNSEPQADGSTAVHTLLRKRRERTREIRVRIHIFQRRHQSSLIDLNVESAEIGETAVSKILVGHPYGMVEDVVEVSAQRGAYPFTKPEVFVQAEIDAPPARSPEQIISLDGRVGEHISSHRWRSKSTRIENLIRNVMLVIAHNERPVSDEIIEVAQGINRGRSDVSRTDEAQILPQLSQVPQYGMKAVPLLAKHLECRLPSADHSVRPLG